MSGILTFYSVYAVALGNALIFGLVGLGILVSLRAGLFNLSETGFMSIAAYTSAVLSVTYHVPVVVAGLAACVACGIIGTAMGLALIRLRGHFLGIATLGFSGLIQGMAVYFNGVTGGDIGFNGIPTYTSNAVLLVLVVLALFMVIRLGRTKLGRAWSADSLDPTATVSLGMSLRPLRLKAFLLTTILSAVAGVMYAGNNISIVPDDFGFTLLTALLTYTIVGGLGGALGPLLGALVLSTLPVWASGLQVYALYVDGGLLIVAILFLPGGFSGLVMDGVRWVRGVRWSRRPGGWRALLPLPQAETGDGAVLPETGEAGWTARLTSHEGPEAPSLAAVTDRGVVLGLPSKPAAGYGLQATAVSKSFGGVQALKGVDIIIRPGEVAGLIGPNGSGKTTLVNCLSGLIRADRGRITVGDQEVTSWDASRIARQARVRRTFQHVRLLADRSVLENVILGMDDQDDYSAAESLVWSGRYRGAEQRRRLAAQNILDVLSLADLGERRPSELPYGARRRVELARALVAQPAVLLVDEPTAGMTEPETRLLGADLRSVAQVWGTAVLVIEHKMQFIRDTCELVTVLHFGEVVSHGTADQVLADPLVAAVYLGGGAAGARVDRQLLREDAP